MLAEHHGNATLVCRSLGIPKRTLYDKMRKLGLSTEELHASDARREAIVNAAAGNRLEAAHDSWRHGPAWAGSGPRPIRAGVPG